MPQAAGGRLVLAVDVDNSSHRRSHLGPADDVPEVTAAQVRRVVVYLIEVGR